MSRQLGGVLGVALVFSLLAGAAVPDSLVGFHPVWLLVTVATGAALVLFALLRPARAAVGEPGADPATNPLADAPAAASEARAVAAEEAER